MNSDEYWEYCKEHVKSLALRDHNHASVFGWSVCNETLPTIIGHYGDEGSMKNWSSQGKPWGVGETGMGYYGTPKQISAVNGNRTYESQLGRMEGHVLIESKKRRRYSEFVCIDV